MEHIFKNGATRKDRPIKIKIDKEFITFHFANEDDREFYYIEIQQWDKHFQYHMEEKNWFTNEMADFINKKSLNNKDVMRENKNLKL